MGNDNKTDRVLDKLIKSLVGLALSYITFSLHATYTSISTQLSNSARIQQELAQATALISQRLGQNDVEISSMAQVQNDHSHSIDKIQATLDYLRENVLKKR